MAQLRARGPYWELAWSGPDLNSRTGKKQRHSRLLGRRSDVPKRDANLALEQLRRELFLDEHRLRARASPSVIEWATEYLTWHCAQWPASHYRVRQVIEQHILPGWEYRHLDSLTDRDIEERLSKWRSEGFRDHTLAKHLRILKAMLNRAVEKGELDVSPADSVMQPQILDSAPHLFYETDELEALYLASSFDQHHPDEPQHADWHAPAWKFLANTGIRRGEALSLKRTWVKSKTVQVLSTSSARTKSGKWREIPFFPGAQEGLEALDALLGDRDYLLPRVTPSSLSRAAAKCIARADLEGGIHTLRHTFISHLAMDPRVPIRDIQLWAGHASIATTEKYMYLRRAESPIALAL